MRTLRTPLSTLLRIRHNAQEQSERRLAHAVARYRAIRQHIAQLQRKKQDTIIEQDSSKSSGAGTQTHYDREMREVADRYLRFLHAQQLQSEDKLHQAQRQLSIQRQEYHRAYREHSAYQELYRRKLHQHKITERRREQYHYDEIAEYQWRGAVNEIAPSQGTEAQKEGRGLN